MSKFYDILMSLGEQGEAHIENIVHTLEEGLVKSYPKELVIKNLKVYFFSRHNLKIFVDGSRDENQYFAIIARDVDMVDYVDEVNSYLEVYGWYVVKSNKHRLVIEPRIADKSLNEKEGWKYYHITNQTYYDKIKKNGLNPRESTTTFNHPADRIYLLYTDSLELVKHISMVLFRDKKSKLDKDGNDDGRWDFSNTVILEVDLPEGVEKFSDPMAQGDSTFDAVYVKKSINPNNLTKL